MTNIGTPIYMSPEQIKREGYGLKSDIWFGFLNLSYMLKFDKSFLQKVARSHILRNVL